MQAALLLPGRIIEQVRIDDVGVAAMARSREIGAICPACGVPSSRIHSRYVRFLSDLPAHGRRVLLPGVLREELIEPRRCSEAPLRPSDLCNAPFWVGNSLRGLIAAKLALGRDGAAH